MQVVATGGTPPYSYSTAGLPDCKIDISTGLFTAGSTAGEVTVSVLDSAGNSATTAIGIVSTAAATTTSVNFAMNSATSNDVLPNWPASNVLDGNATTIYSSNIFTTSTNDRAVFIAAWFSAGAQTVNSLFLTGKDECRIAIGFSSTVYGLFNRLGGLFLGQHRNIFSPT